MSRQALAALSFGAQVEAPNPNLSGVFEAAMEIARQRRETLVQLRAALEQGDQPNINRFARELCGLNNEQTSNRVN